MRRLVAPNEVSLNVGVQMTLAPVHLCLVVRRDVERLNHARPVRLGGARQDCSTIAAPSLTLVSRLRRTPPVWAMEGRQNRSPCRGLPALAWWSAPTPVRCPKIGPVEHSSTAEQYRHGALLCDSC